MTTFPPLGAKYFGWVCAGPRLLKIKRQRSSTFTLLLILRSYWFDKPRFVIEGKQLLATSTPSLGAPPNSSSIAINVRGDASEGAFPARRLVAGRLESRALRRRCGSAEVWWRGDAHSCQRGGGARACSARSGPDEPAVIELQGGWGGGPRDRKSTRLNSSHITRSRMPSSA